MNGSGNYVPLWDDVQLWARKVEPLLFQIRYVLYCRNIITAQVIFGGWIAIGLGFLIDIRTRSVAFIEADCVTIPDASFWLVAITLSPTCAPVTRQRPNVKCCGGIGGKSIVHELKMILEICFQLFCSGAYCIRG